MPQLPLRSPWSAARTWSLVALCAMAAGCGGSSGGGGASSLSTATLLCKQPGVSGTPAGAGKVRAMVSTPKQTRLLGVGVDGRYLVWTQRSKDGSGVVCQQRLATREVTALARGNVLPQNVVTTDKAVYFVASGSRGPSLFEVDHGGRRSREVATGLTAPISASGRYVAYADQPEVDVERVTVLDSSRDNATVQRFRFGACNSSGEHCAPVTSLSMVPNGVAWMRHAQDGGGALLTVRPLNGTGITRPVEVSDAALYPSDLFPVFDDLRKGHPAYAAWLISSGVRQVLGSFGRDDLLTVAGGAAFALHTEGSAQTVRGYSLSSGRVFDMDDLSGLTRGGSHAELAGTAVAGRRFCDVVNVFSTATPSDTEMPGVSFVRCGHIPAV
jgi:hypothetical protein